MRKRKKHGINQMNIFKLLTSLDNMTVKIQEGSNIVLHSGIFIQLLCVELLIIVIICSGCPNSIAPSDCNQSRWSSLDFN